MHPRGNTIPPAAWLDLSDEALLADCRFEAVRGAGPGGQKRNKTSNAIHLRHLPTGVHVIAGESRSQLENKQRAIRRLKLRLACEIRHPIAPIPFVPRGWFADVVQQKRLAASHRHPRYAQAASLILDLLEHQSGRVGDVAIMLSVTTSSLVKFLVKEPQLWQAATRIRKAAGLVPLEHP